MDIDKIPEIIQRKVLKGTHLPIEIKEIQAGYLCSPYFKDLYLYLSQTSNQKDRNTCRKVCYVGLTIVQNLPRQGDSSFSSARNMCRQNYISVSQKPICRTSGSYKNVLNYQ